jgi:hypothetical protein
MVSKQTAPISSSRGGLFRRKGEKREENVREKDKN